MTTVYFVRHAQSDNSVRDGAIRPLTDKGMFDRSVVTEYLQDKNIDHVISSPYKRAVDTVADFAEKNGIEIEIIHDFRERKSDSDWVRDTDFWPFIESQWNDFTYSLSDGECLAEVQQRNIAALNGALAQYAGQNIVIGTHGTALSAIINYYDRSYGFDDFMAMVNIMPWVVIMEFDELKCVSISKLDIMAVKDIPDFQTLVKSKPVTKGWSGDKKYYIETADGKRMLLRVSDIAELDRKKAEYGMMECVYGLGVLTSQPLGFGLCDGGKSCYSLSEWLDGEDAESVLPLMSETERYVLGWKSGEMLRKIHSTLAPEGLEDWAVRFEHKVENWIGKYNAKAEVHSDIGEKIICYLKEHRDVLVSRTQTLIHGDYNTENIMVMLTGETSVIDFNNYNSVYGDQWWDLNNMAWIATMFPHFYSGQIRGYFNGEPPTTFWNVLTYYLAFDALAALTDPYGLNGIEDGTEIVNNILRWMDNFQNPVPTWYLKDYHVQYIDGILCRLKEPFDFSFLNEYGKVFKIFDAQSSGCICFSVSNEKNKYFIKFAGVRTINNYDLPVSDAVARLKAAVPKYKDLAHPLLIHFIESKEVGNGYITVFDWENGESFGDQNSCLHERFSSLPANNKIEVFEEILRFHEHVAKCGYVAIDFNDNSTLCNFDNGRVKICDIDFYAKQSYINGMGRVLGDPAVMSPEEYRIGGLIDEITNVYTMGATAFVLFSNNDRSLEAWPLGEKLYEVASKAVSEERCDRQQSIQQLIDEWEAVK